MKKYIKINSKKEVIDVFFDYQKNKFDGSEIFYKETDLLKHKINNKNISDKNGYFIFKYISGEIIEISSETIEESVEFIEKYQEEKKEELKSFLMDNLLTLIKPNREPARTFEDIVLKWNEFLHAITSCNKKKDIDVLYATVVTWLNQ